MTDMEITFRKAEASDAFVISDMIHKLAEYENLADLCTLDNDTLLSLMNEKNGLEVFIALANGKAVGIMTYYFFRIATFSGKRVLYIEDIFVCEEYRGNGIGTEFFRIAKDTAEKNGCIRMEWKCLEWNMCARKFYDRAGGLISKDWLTYTLEL